MSKISFVNSADTEIDQKGLEEFLQVRERIAPRWQTGTLDILTQLNQELLSKLNGVESKIETMIRIPNKPKELKKRWKELLEEYENINNLAIAYAARHKI